MEAYFRVWPDEAELLKSVDLSRLTATVEHLKLAQVSSDMRAFKLWMPEELQASLEAAAEKRHKKKDVLLAAAREFRRKFPQSRRLLDHVPDMDNEWKGKRKSMVLRLDPAEHRLMQDLGRGNAKIGNRYDALIEMARIIDNMDLEDRRNHKRVTVYLPIPEQLHLAIERRHKETGLSRVQILLEAVRRRQ